MAVAFASVVVLASETLGLRVSGGRTNDGPSRARGRSMAVWTFSPRPSETMMRALCPQGVRPDGRASRMRAPEGAQLGPARSSSAVQCWPPLSLESSREEEDHGSLRWPGRTCAELHAGSNRAFGQTPEVDGGGDERAGTGGGGTKHCWTSAPVFGGGDAERLAVRAAGAARGGSGGGRTRGAEGTQGRSARRLGAGRGAADRGHSDARLQGPTTPGGAAQFGARLWLRGQGCGAGEEPAQVGVPLARDRGRRGSVRAQGTKQVAPQAAEAPSRPGRVAWSATGRPVAATGGGRRVAAQRGQDTPDHPDALDGTRDGNHPLCADGGRSGDPGAIPNASPVLELLGALHRDAIIGGLGTRQGRTIDALSRAPDARPDAQAERPPQVGVQGSGYHGDCAVARRPAAHCVRASGAGGCEAQPGQAHAGSPHRRHRAVDVEEPGGVRPGSPSARDRQDAGAFVGEASAARCVFGDTAREGFEGEHPLVSWSPGRDGESPVEGYAPSEYPLKRWPFEAQSGAWCPRFAGGQARFRFELLTGRPDSAASRISSPPVHSRGSARRQKGALA